VDVLPWSAFWEVMDHRAFEQDLSRVGSFDPAGQMGVHHRQTLLFGNRDDAP